MLRSSAIVLISLLTVSVSEVLRSRALHTASRDDRWTFPLAGPRYSYEQWKQRCEAPNTRWVVEYVEWHRQNRNARNAKILKYHCPVKRSGVGQGTCQGLGDRVRGMLFLLRFAAKARRLFLIDMEHPAPMEEFLAPSGILDWRTTGLDVTPTPWHHPPWWQLTEKEEGGLHTLDERVIAIETNEPIDKDQKGYPHVDLYSNTTHCLFHALFQASPRTLKAAEQHFKMLGLDPRRGYTAVHFRLGGAVGEEETLGPLTNTLPQLLTYIKCARLLSSQHGLVSEQAAHKLVVLTDHTRLRKFISDGFFTDVVAAPIVPHHFDMANQGLHGLFNTMADLTVLAHASCLIAGQSGFARMARWWSFTPCFLDLGACPGLVGTSQRRQLLASTGSQQSTALSLEQLLQDGPASDLDCVRGARDAVHMNATGSDAELACGLRKLRAWLSHTDQGQQQRHPGSDAQGFRHGGHRHWHKQGGHGQSVRDVLTAAENEAIQRWATSELR